MRRDRRDEILERLGGGPASAQELAELFGISREGVLRWLRLLEADGKIRSTAAARTSRTNRWVLTEMPDGTDQPLP
jgi:predicted ArsR family transcriptional regulator